MGESEKAEWNEKAKKDKLRYQKEMEDYSAPSDDDSSDDDSDDGKGKKKAKAKAKKDPNAPKRPKNAYMFYANSVRAQIREENPDLSMPDVSKEIGMRYKALSEAEQAKWQAKADAAKEVYKKEMVEYEKTKPDVAKKSDKMKKKKKPEPKQESSDSSDSSESDADDSDDSDSD